jgi:hypothetical protein
MVDFGSEQGLSAFETGAIAGAISRISEERKRRSGQKMPSMDGHSLVGKIP